MKDLILASICNYTFDKVKCWLNSIKMSGFTGDILIICADIDEETYNKLTEEEVLIYHCDLQPNQHIVVERFHYYWNILNRLEEQYRYVICTDVSDVIFQRNPSDWLSENIGDEKLIASSESIKYKDEIWGYHNIRASFGVEIGEELDDLVIFNAGVIAGEPSFLKNLFKVLYFMCDGKPSQVAGGGGPDQAAYNILLSTQRLEDVYFATSESAWAAQLGTTGDPFKIKRYEPLLVEPKPVFKDGVLCTYITGEPFFIVHQYNRVPEIKEAFEAKYGC